jgi:glycosyltransferase involved in cell wall biosynthesis
MEVDWVSGACMIIRRDAIDQIGVMDERFFMYWEDADLCKRMWQGGWKVIYYPVPCVMHLVGVSSNQLLTRSVYEFHKSSYLLFIKYSQPRHWFIKPIIILALMNRLLVVLLADILRALFVRLHTSHRRLKLPQPFTFERPVKILRFIARLNIGGPAIHVHLLTKGLDTGRFASKLVTGQISPQEGDMSYLFTSSAKKPIIIPELQREINLFLDFRAWLKIFRLLKREKPALIHTHTSKAGPSARLGAILYNLTSFSHVRMVHTFHGHIFEGYFSPFKSYLFVLIERFLASFTDVIIAISDTQKKDLSLRFKIAPPQKFKTVGLGFNLEPFLNASKKQGRFRRSLGVASSTVLVGIIGRLAPIKNHKMFLEAASCLVNRSPDCDVCFIIIGDGELRADLEDYCRQKGLTTKVHFCGWIKEVDEVYADLDVLALTSNNEGTPVSIIEAMAACVPVVATDVGGVHDILGQKEYECGPLGFTICEHGLLCAKNDPKGFCNGLQFVIENATAEKTREHKAQQFIQKHFAIERLLNDIDGLYTDLLSASQRKYTYARIPAKSTKNSTTCR